MMLRCLH